MNKELLHIGLDVGSTTVKVVAFSDVHKILHKTYQRHYSDITKTMIDTIDEVCHKFKGRPFTVAVAGSGGISVSTRLGIKFVQEVIASTAAIQKLIPQTDVAIELGGEDAKITFFDNGIDQRMNETCAGGTGAFIDQMASVLQTDAKGLNDLAANHTTLYPIAARCGVFAKTDVMPLLNEGASQNDIAASILQAVVDQTIGGLACGRSIKGNIAFLGGPLYFLPELRQRFIETLKLTDDEILFPENAQYFVAIGTALISQECPVIHASDLQERIDSIRNRSYKSETEPLPSLFKTAQELKMFKARHNKNHAEFIEFKDAIGPLYLGIDAGSTTTKAIILDTRNRIAYQWYGSNKGTPLISVIEILKDIYDKMPYTTYIHNSAVTGYGEALLQAALGIDEGEVETMVHCKAAKHFLPDVSFILDIGGQDMKGIYVKYGAVSKLVLNEACSSGCGSFVETFAHSLGMNVKDFAEEALKSTKPVDLGSRCTVFMNSKVKQAQKEGASVADISAGLSYSVIRNALYKVLKISSPGELGNKVIVQGGTFLNNSILRALELLLGITVERPNIAGMMGAFGAALLAKEKAVKEKRSSILSPEKLMTFSVKTRNYRCKLCSNRCLITANMFSDGRKFISGNRCERGAGQEKKTTNTVNLFSFKYNRLFEHYVPIPKDKAKRGSIGIPRGLNMYENYPFWFTFFTKLDYHVVLSDPSSREFFNAGLETIPSQTICYPAKMLHGHIINLIDKGVKRIFYPGILFENKEFQDADNNFNCPVVASYPEVIRLNMDRIKEENVEYIEPYLPIHNIKLLARKLYEVFSPDGVTTAEIRNAVKASEEEQDTFKKEIRHAGENALQKLKENKQVGIVLAGRPYHLDPAINHGIPEMIASRGITVFTEDSLCHLGKIPYKLDAVDQWVYHSRLYRVASLVSETEELELVQLNSFGCGLDAITSDQVEEILSSTGKSYTLLKIDEGSNLGAARIRIRSLMANLKEKENSPFLERKMPVRTPQMSKEMKDTHTILCPQLSPIHFFMLSDCFKPYGYTLEVLQKVSKADIEEGLKYVNNDACFPAITVVGQLINALKSGKYDTDKTALMISQTGGGCRATNYVRFLKSAVIKAGFPNVPIVPLNMAGLNENEGFNVTTGMLHRIMYAVLYGDLLLRVSNRTRPYEVTEGSVDTLTKDWTDRLKSSVRNASRKEFEVNVCKIIDDFDSIPLQEMTKPKVGVVGEILVKFHPDANNQLVKLIEKEGGEAVVPDFMDFILYCALDTVNQRKLWGGQLKKSIINHLEIAYIEWYRDIMRKHLKKSKRFTSFYTIKQLADLVDGVVSLANQTGEGWLLTAEMIELIKCGVPNIVLVQPFACLPNHITGKGVIKELKRRYPIANIVAMDYDPGATEVNQVNRMKLMMTVALNNIRKEIPADENHNSSLP